MASALALICTSVSAVVPARLDAQVVSPSLSDEELLQVLGSGVVGRPETAPPFRDLVRIARWESGEWRYRITSGPRSGQTEVESLALINATARGETWKRTIGQESTLFIREVSGIGLVLPSQVTHGYDALVYFEPPLSYLLVGLKPGETRTFDGRMEVYSAKNPSLRWYTGRIRATTVYAGVYRITTPAGAFSAAVIKSEYHIDIFAVVSVKDTLYTFYADGVGKVAEAEHRRIAAMGLFNSDTRVGKVLVSYRSLTPPPANNVESP
jgi:hypothetical protein